MSKRNKHLLNLDRQYIWHPYTQMKDYESRYPILVKKAKGLKIYDSNGQFYYDTISSWWCNILGHNVPEINNEISKQLKNFEHVLFAGFTNEPAIKLGEKLIQLSHKNLQKVFYSDNGSTAVETALKLSFQFWKNSGYKKKEKFIFLENSYHGDTIGGMSVSGVSQFNNVFRNLFFKSYMIPSPYCYRCPAGKLYNSCARPCAHPCAHQCLTPLKKILKEHSDEITGIILEPLVQGAGGIIIYPVSYLNKLYEIVHKYDIHIIIDEIAVGFGRTGKMFASQYSTIQPDFICLSKALTNGTLPLGVTLTSNDIYKAFYDDFSKNKTFFHGHTFTGNPISTSAALVTLNLLEKRNLIKDVNKKGTLLKRLILESIQNNPYIGDIRQIGLILAIEIVKDKKTKKPFNGNERIGWKIYLEGLRHNLILRPLGNVIYFYLPLIITLIDIDIIVENLQKTLNKVFEN